MSFGSESTTDEVLEGVELRVHRGRCRRPVLRGLSRRHTGGDPSSRGGVNAYALDPETGKALWARFEELVGEAFPT